MKSKRTRLALMGVMALVLSVTVGLVSGGVADAKKKKKKGAKTFAVAKTTPTAIPLANAGGPGVVKVPIGIVGGKKLKGKVISFSSVTVTTSWSGGPGFGSNPTFATLIAPNGRSVGLVAPAFDGTSAAQGPVTETPDSPASYCTPVGAPPPPPCNDPDANVLGPAYAGTIGNAGLSNFGGISPNGTWQIKLFNADPAIPATLNSISVNGNLINALPSS
jgi:hypothetical protein